MKVRLLRDMVERIVGGPDGKPVPVLKTTVHKGRNIIWAEGTEMEMSEASARKFIERGDAEPVLGAEAEGELEVIAAADVGELKL